MAETLHQFRDMWVIIPHFEGRALSIWRKEAVLCRMQGALPVVPLEADISGCFGS